ncbi:SDR family NAD(P)-dependent oxidoreductase [Steroidobacter flavus]|uniref:SDR family NAD(P)-dependent oxidoreductase n=1 Tax=Steroidobacter flavus TaxID=1842136 RepID=A0ABV8SY35_9GAMM
MDLGQCSAIVSGGAGGLGAATSRRLVEIGLGVVVFDPDGDRAADVAKDLGNRAIAVRGDQSSDADVTAAIAAARTLGVFSVAVNAAGVPLPAPHTATADGIPHDMSLFRNMLEMHLMGPFNVSRLSAAAFAGNSPDADGQRGVIVNTSSTAAFDGQMKQVAYTSAKAGIAGMALAMARDLAGIGVRVCAIAPGPIWTPRLARAPESLKQALISNVAFPKRFGHAEEYALLVEAIVRNPFLNGQVIRLDGALSTPLTDMSPGRTP